MGATGADGGLGALAAAARRALARTPAPGVTLWVVDLDSLPEAVLADRMSLTPHEHESAARRRAPLGERYLRRRLVRRALLAAHAGIDVDEVRLSSRCRRCGDPAHGKPMLAPAPVGALPPVRGDHRRAREQRMEFNDASCEDIFVMAVSEGPVGVDVERPSRLDDVLAARVDRFTSRRWPALDAALPSGLPPVGSWTAGEALSKAVGLGLWASAEDMAGAVEAWTVRWFEPMVDVVVCVATTAPAPAIVVRALADVLGAL